MVIILLFISAIKQLGESFHSILPYYRLISSELSYIAVSYKMQVTILLLFLIRFNDKMLKVLKSRNIMRKQCEFHII